MTKKAKPENRPVVEANLIPILQSRVAYRAKYIGSAEQHFALQRDIVRQFRAVNGPFTPEQKEQVGKVLSQIRSDIKELARDQKIDRTLIKTMSAAKAKISADKKLITYLQNLFDATLGVAF